VLKAELLEIIANGENSGVEFKRDDLRPEQIAKEIVALANLKGGRILLGVEDDGAISGIKRENLEEWIMDTVFARYVHPLILPFYEEIKIEENVKVAVITIEPCSEKPYVLRNNGREDIYIRLGSTSRMASREQQIRLFETGGMLHVELLPVTGTSLSSLDLTRLEYYLRVIIRDSDIPQSETEWEERLLGMGLMTKNGRGNTVCTIAGLLCFGIKPRRYIPEAGIRVMSFTGSDKEYQARLDVMLDGPLVGRWQIDSGQKILADDGLVEKFTATILPFITVEKNEIDAGFRREKTWLYPWEAVREAVINALAHRDWTRPGEIEAANYSNRFEVISPGRLQNSMTVAKMIAGQRSARNPLITDILRDYGYTDARGMGVRTKIIPLMKQHNKAGPVFEAAEDYLKITLPGIT
jgi:ATP-dependent DNA helicase RecG